MKSTNISFLTFLLSALIVVWVFISTNTSASAYYGCGQGPCNNISAPCSVPYTCNPNPGGVCGVFYNACVGATCSATGGFDSSTCSTGNACPTPGTTRTASLGACSATCGPGTQTCNCGAQNNCPVTCTGGKACGDNTTVCCVDQVPQTKPTITSCTQVGATRTAQVNWSFSGIDGCSQAWGYNCASNSDTFQLRFSGGKTNENAAKTDSTLTTGNFPDWGTYTVQVCALNGSGENCSVVGSCVLTAPECSVSGQPPGTSVQSPTSGCINTDPNLTSTFGYGANEMNFLVKTSSDLSSGPYSATSGWTGLTSYTPSLTTGTYYWNALSRSTASPVSCNTGSPYPTGYPIGIDKDLPSKPVGSFSVSPDGSCLNKYFLTYQWSASADNGCGNSLISYQSDIANDGAHASPVGTNPTGLRQITTTSSYLGNTIVYGRAQAVDAANNSSGWSTDASDPITIPLPSPYPTIHLRGNYIEDTGSCSAPGEMNIDPSALVLNFTFSNPTVGITPICNKGPAGGSSSYSCNIIVDNSGSSSCVTPNHTITLNASYGGYSSVNWRNPDTCVGVPTGQSFDASAPSPISANLYFKFDTTQGWFKTSSTSFVNRSTAVRNNIIPNAVVAFDVSDDSSKHVIAGGAGIVSKSSTLNLGANAMAGGQVEYSSNNWSSPNYATNSIFTPSKFTDYVKSRKKYVTITALNEITQDGIYYIAGNLTINSSAIFDNKKVVIIADKGTVTIGANLTPINASIAVIADKVVIADAVTEVDGIIIGNNVAVNDGVVFTNKLKIDGNLIHLSDTLSFTNTRTTATPRSPSLYVKFNQATYLNLLPYLSVSLYDWRQLQ